MKNVMMEMKETLTGAPRAVSLNTVTVVMVCCKELWENSASLLYTVPLYLLAALLHVVSFLPFAATERLTPESNAMLERKTEIFQELSVVQIAPTPVAVMASRIQEKSVMMGTFSLVMVVIQHAEEKFLLLLQH